MILLTRLDNSKVLVNLDTVKYVERTPDTLVSFVNGDSVIVRESLEEVDHRVIEYRIRILKAATDPGNRPAD